MAMARLILASIAAMLASTAPAPAGTLCAGIRAVVADAENGFDDLRGDRTDQKQSTVEPFYTIDYYAARGWPQGALTCYIERRDEPTRDGRRYPNYYCEYPMHGTDKAAALRKVADRIASCVKGAGRPTGAALNKNGGMLSWDTKNANVHFSAFAGASNPNLRVLIQADNR